MVRSCENIPKTHLFPTFIITFTTISWNSYSKLRNVDCLSVDAVNLIKFVIMVTFYGNKNLSSIPVRSKFSANFEKKCHYAAINFFCVCVCVCTFLDSRDKSLIMLKSLSERSKKSKQKKKNKGSAFVAESAFVSQKKQFGLVMVDFLENYSRFYDLCWNYRILRVLLSKNQKICSFKIILSNISSNNPAFSNLKNIKINKKSYNWLI